MMIVPSPDVLDQLIRDRQENLKTTPCQADMPARPGLRVRIGRALIAIGSTLSGEPIDLPARPPALPSSGLRAAKV